MYMNQLYTHKNVRFHHSFHLNTYKVDLTYLKVLTTINRNANMH